MHSRPDTRGLRIVSSKQRMALSAEILSSPGLQRSLFNEDPSWLIVFVCVHELPDGFFSQVMRNSEPSFVFDLRLAPRFDIGTLNRQRALALFEQLHTKYIDAAMPLIKGVKREEAIEMLIRQLPAGGVEASKPLVFLYSRAESSLATPAEICSMLAHSARRVDVIHVPERLEART